MPKSRSGRPLSRSRSLWTPARPIFGCVSSHRAIPTVQGTWLLHTSNSGVLSNNFTGTKQSAVHVSAVRETVEGSCFAKRDERVRSDKC
eukprot:6020878-Pyramimonas_sp.AAC.1